MQTKVEKESFNLENCGAKCLVATGRQDTSNLFLHCEPSPLLTAPNLAGNLLPRF